MSRLLRRLIGAASHAELVAFHARLDAIERAEWNRNAEHASMVDKLDRIYKRFSARITREAAPAEPPSGGESPLSLRERLRGHR